MEQARSDRQEDIQTGRKICFDHLRVFATFAVVILHISTKYWYSADVGGYDWQVSNFFDSIVRWAVPVFVMISGALFLDREIPLKKIYSKYVRRMVAAFIVWSAIYALFEDGPLTARLSSLVQGHFHMWFILMIVGLYMCIPFIKAIAGSAPRMKYFLALSFVFAFAIPELSTLAGDFGNGAVQRASDAVGRSIDKMDMQMVLGYTGYFVLGHHLDKTELNRRQRCIIYVLGAAGAAFTIVMDLVVALRTQAPCDHYYGYFNVNVLLEAVAVFTFFKYRRYGNGTMDEIVRDLSKYSFGAYCIHALVFEQLIVRFGLDTVSFDPALTVFFLSLVVCGVSFSVSALLNRIPVLRKYIL